MKKIGYSIILLFFLSTNVFSQFIKDVPTPSIEITGTTGPVDYGEIIQLKAVVDRSKFPDQLSNLKYQWTVFENGKIKQDIIIWPDSSQIFFASGMKAKRVTVILNVTCIYQVKQAVKVVDPAGKVIEGANVITADGKPLTEAVTESGVISPPLLVKEIQVGTTPEPPTPTPPTPNPEPPVPTPTVLPDGKFKLAQTTYDLAIANVPTVARAKAPLVGDSYIKVADRIQQSVSKLAAGVALAADDLQLDVKTIMQEISTSNRSVLGADIAVWQQWDKLYGDALYGLYKDRKMNTWNDWETAFRETALGLKAVH